MDGNKTNQKGNTNMKSMKLGLLAVAVIALITSSAHAATVSASQGDLILGFRATGGTGAGLNLEVNLGPVSDYYNATPGSPAFTVPELVLQDLVDVYGPGWDTRTDLFWGLAAAYSNAEPDPNGKPESTLWVTDAVAPAYPVNTAGGQATPNTRIQGLYTGGAGALNGKTSTTNSDYSAVIDKTLAGSWGERITTANSFGYFNPKIDIAVGGTDKTLDLIELQPFAGTPKPAGTTLGTFTLTSSGLSFQAIPEPSSMMLVFMGLGMSVMVRRHTKLFRS
jgi:hypothetical protein